MNTLRPYFKKELLEWIRTPKFIILAAITLFFTFSTPVMLYALPLLLKEQMPELVDFLQASQKISMTNFMGDVYQIFGGVLLYLSFTSYKKEFQNGQFITPWITGANIKKVYLSKFISISIITSLLVIVSSSFSHFYAGFIFDDFTLKFAYTFNQTISIIVFILVHNALLLLLCSKQLKTYIIIPFVYGSYYALPGFISMFDFKFSTPYDLLNLSFATKDYQGVVIGLACILFLLGLSIITIKNVNIGDNNGRKATNYIRTGR